MMASNLLKQNHQSCSLQTTAAIKRAPGSSFKVVHPSKTARLCLSVSTDFPHVCVFFLFLVLYTVRLLSSSFRACFVTHTLTHIFHTELCHTQLYHTQLCHTQSLSHTIFHVQFCHTQLCRPSSLTHAIFHTQLCRTPPFPHNFVTHNFVSHTHHLSRTTLSHTTLSHTIFHTQLCHAPSLWRRGTWRYRPAFVLRGRRGTLALGWVWWCAWGPLVARGATALRGTWRRPPALCQASVALGDIHLHFAWQVRRLWHWAGSGGALGARWSPGAPRPALCVAGEALGDTHLHLAWRGMWRQPPTFCAAGVALMALSCFAWQAWHLATSTYVFPGRRGTCSHQPSFCLAGVELGDIHAASEPISLKYDFPHIFVWGSCLWFCIPSALPSFRPSVRSSRPPPLFLTQLCHTPTLSHTIFHTQLCHTTLSHTTLHIQLLSYRSSASTISFVLSAFSVLLFVIIGRI